MRPQYLRRVIPLRMVRSSNFPSFCTNTASSSSTVDTDEIGRFSSLAKVWWDDEGPMKALHSMNRIRVPWIRDTLLQYRPINADGPTAPVHRPLTSFRILDVGCGAGFLTEPLARLGANVVGIDASMENIEMAKEHAGKRKDDVGLGERLIYHSKSIEEFAKDDDGRYFDGVIASEVIEHVSSKDTFVENCLRLTKPNGGCLFFTTINRTELSRYLAIYAAERLLRIVPDGTHDWNKFVPPDDLQFLLEKNGDCRVRLIHGTVYNPITNSWYWTRNQSVNYALYAMKT